MPDATPDLTDRIAEVVQGPAQASDAAGGMSQHNPKDLIEVDKYLRQKKADRSRSGGVRYNRTRPPGPGGS